MAIVLLRGAQACRRRQRIVYDIKQRGWHNNAQACPPTARPPRRQRSGFRLTAHRRRGKGCCGVAGHCRAAGVKARHHAPLYESAVCVAGRYVPQTSSNVRILPAVVFRVVACCRGRYAPVIRHRFFRQCRSEFVIRRSAPMNTPDIPD